MEKDFNNVIAIEKAKKEQEKEQKKLTLESITPEELDALVERVDNFHGTRKNEKNIERFNRLRDTVKWLMGKQNGIRAWGEMPANEESRNAQVWLDFGAASFMSDKNANAFRLATDLADCIYIVAKGGEDYGVRVSFVVKNCMEE